MDKSKKELDEIVKEQTKAQDEEAKAQTKEITETPEAEATGKVVVCGNKDKYTKTKTPSGKVSMSCGDAVALAYGGLAIEDKYKLTSELLGVDRKGLEEKYSHLNIGMQGMSLANRARGAINKDEKLEKPSGVMNKMAEIVAPIQAKADAKVKADADADAKAKVKATMEKKAQAKADADAQTKEMA